jgi:L-serine dehydratase
MKTIKALFKIGHGPSSSHTMGPAKICQLFKKDLDADAYKVILYGSLSKTGKGHLTDYIIKQTLTPVEIEFSRDGVEHPNTMDLFAYKNQQCIKEARFYSVGGGSIIQKGETKEAVPTVYPHHSFREVSDYCEAHHLSLHEYVYLHEEDDFKAYLRDIWRVMKQSIHDGLHTTGDLPGPLEVTRKARGLLENPSRKSSNELRLVSAFAYAVAEMNASGGQVVTAPTCGASGVVPAVLYYLKDVYKFSDEKILDGLATAGLIGNIVKHNASISGAEAGCQAEIGTACSMAAAAYNDLFGLSIEKIEYAAEIALEHHLGLTCDPVGGYVQIPCIERNAVAAHRAINASELSSLLIGSRKISFDLVVETMRQTGLDMNENYRETSLGGLAKYYK